MKDRPPEVPQTNVFFNISLIMMIKILNHDDAGSSGASVDPLHLARCARASVGGRVGLTGSGPARAWPGASGTIIFHPGWGWGFIIFH